MKPEGLGCCSHRHHLVSAARSDRPTRPAIQRRCNGSGACDRVAHRRCRPSAGLIASQIAVFGFTEYVSVHWSVWAQIFARFIWPRIGASAALEDARPARFAQFISFVLTASALLGFLVGLDGIGYGFTAVAVAVAGAALNALAGVCLGCRTYLLAHRRQGART